MTLEFYKIFHLIGVIMIFLAIGGAVIRAALDAKNEALEKFILMNHGIAGLLVFSFDLFGQSVAGDFTAVTHQAGVHRLFLQ